MPNKDRASADRRPTLRAFGAAVTGAAVLVAPAAAGPGPDIAVSDMPDLQAYGSDGAGIFAFAFGTTACNTGSADVQWVRQTPAHPVIAMNVYRLKGGRFEQIGLSWAKHARFASNDADCGYLCNGPPGAILWIGCSDVYSAGTNGNQAFLGPRSDINAATGAFAYDDSTPATWPPYTGPIARRVQIAQGDLAFAQNIGAIYFAEGVYIAADDAAAGNSWDNASYRRISFMNDAVFSPAYSPANPIRTGSPAILAWREADPAVRAFPVDIPGDGRFWIAERVTDNGNGTWHYEFAVENLNSHRSGGSLAVPIAPGTSVANAQFRGVAYHSGEPYDNSPWTIAIGADRVSFAVPQTFADNPNTSALRWATLYNFRFDAAGPSVLGAATLGLFRPGSGQYASLNSVAVGILTPGGAAPDLLAPVNDDCAGAIPVHAGQNGFSTLGATSSGPAVWVDSGSSEILADVWFTYTFNDTCAGAITFSTCGSDFDTKIAVYAGGPGVACPPADPPLACNDDSATPCNGQTTHSSVSVAAAPGATYLIRVGSRTGTAGNGLLTIDVPRCVPAAGACCIGSGLCIQTNGPVGCANYAPCGIYLGEGSSCSPVPCPSPGVPVNDLCANAVFLADLNAGGSVVRGTNLNAGTDGGPAMCHATALRDVWYVYIPAATGLVSVDLCASDPGNPCDVRDFGLDVRPGACNAAPIACSDNSCGPSDWWPSVSAPMTAGTIYYIRVFGAAGSQGTFGIRVQGGGGTIPGACCLGSICSLRPAGACPAVGARFAGAGTVCNAPGNNTLPCCRADFNQSGAITMPDVYFFLAAWFLGSPSANFTANGAGPPGVQSLFDFLAAWFAGGC